MVEIKFDVEREIYKKLFLRKDQRTWREFILGELEIIHEIRRIGRPKTILEVIEVKKKPKPPKISKPKPEPDKPIVEKAEPPEKKRYRYYCERCNKQYEDKTNRICDCGGPIRLK